MQENSKGALDEIGGPSLIPTRAGFNGYLMARQRHVGDSITRAEKELAALTKYIAKVTIAPDDLAQCEQAVLDAQARVKARIQFEQLFQTAFSEILCRL